jgi:hypothetical protein
VERLRITSIFELAELDAMNALVVYRDTLV